MSPRERRLRSDLAQLSELAEQGHLAFRTAGDPPEQYEVIFFGPGLAREPDGQLAVRRLHRCDLYLHLEYPRRPPVVTWKTPIFHPNLLPPERNGGVCVGSWSAAESLADLCSRLHALATYRSLNPHDALDKEAAQWALDHDVTPGADVQTLATLPVGEQPVVVTQGGAR
ncbi:MAG TPA: ubiquitin-conjugating enzyme E2 [Solirubrobacteraceae bacterium]|jgi:ubiquitin-protein ligase